MEIFHVAMDTMDISLSLKCQLSNNFKECKKETHHCFVTNKILTPPP